MRRCTRLPASRNERKCPSSNRAFFIERLDGGSYDNIMATEKEQKYQLPDDLRRSDEIQAAIDYGIDISALIDNLKRTPAERIRRHQIALDTMKKLRKAKNKGAKL